MQSYIAHAVENPHYGSNHAITENTVAHIVEKYGSSYAQEEDKP